MNKAVFGKVRPIDHDYQPPEVWQPYNAAEAALSLEPSTLEHRELLEHAVEELGPLLKLTEKGAPHRLRCLIRDREVRHESMREVVDSAKEVADHDKRIERMKRRMFAANTKPRGGATPYVQMVRLLNSENYHVELVKNCNAYGLGNPTWRPRAFVFAYAANPGEDLIVPEGVTILEEESESEEEYE